MVIKKLYKVGKCKLSDRLKEADLSQQQLSEMCNIPKSQISEYVNNKHIMSIETAKNISIHLKCNIEDLYEFNTVADDDTK